MLDRGGDSRNAPRVRALFLLVAAFLGRPSLQQCALLFTHPPPSPFHHPPFFNPPLGRQNHRRVRLAGRHRLGELRPGSSGETESDGVHTSRRAGAPSPRGPHPNLTSLFISLPLHLSRPTHAQDLRSKTRTIDFIPKSPSELPKWNYDGSSTGQVRGRKGREARGCFCLLACAPAPSGHALGRAFPLSPPFPGRRKRSDRSRLHRLPLSHTRAQARLAR